MLLARHAQSHFNLHFGRHRRDPGIVDTPLTKTGRRQAEELARSLEKGIDGTRLSRLIVSPYHRTLETAEIVNRALGLEITVEPLVCERAYFLCDIGTSRSALERRWPQHDFGTLEEIWWLPLEESEANLVQRSVTFREKMRSEENWAGALVITHWGFIRALTGHEVGNCQVIGCNPMDSHPEVPALGTLPPPAKTPDLKTA